MHTTYHEAYGPGYEQEHEEFLGGIVGGLTGGAPAAPLRETQELELAVQLLEVGTEQELEYFLDGVFSAVGDAIGRFVRSDTGRSLGGILKDAAKRALPLVRKAVGDWMGPQQEVGARHLAAEAGSLLGLELEGLSPQDQEFEAARQFVRFASTAAQHAALAPPTFAPETVANAAATAAAHSFAPGLAREVTVRDHRRGATPPSRPAAAPTHRRQAPYSPVVRDHRQHSYAAAPRYRQPWAATVRPGPQWPVGYGAGYRRPYGWATQARPWAPGATRWWGGYRAPGQYGAPWRPHSGWYTGMPSRGYAGAPWGGYGGVPWPVRRDWSQVRVFAGDGPPPAPPGAPGRWIYRGHRHGRRRWAWIPAAIPPEPTGPPAGGGGPGFALEPPPAPPPPEQAPPPPPIPAPVDVGPLAPPDAPLAPLAPQAQQNGGPPPGSGEIGRW